VGLGFTRSGDARRFVPVGAADRASTFDREQHHGSRGRTTPTPRTRAIPSRDRPRLPARVIVVSRRTECRIHRARVGRFARAALSRRRAFWYGTRTLEYGRSTWLGGARSNDASRRRGALAGAMALMMLAGCGALERFEDGGATVFVFATHHATPENGAFPGRGAEDMPRVFDTAEGWTVTMLEGYVTISGVALIGCNGREHELDMFWGPCPEDLKEQDLATLTVAGKRVPKGDYCTLRVTYAAYETPIVDEDHEETRHETPSNPAVQGATAYLRGGAQLGEGAFTQFELATAATVVVDLDLGSIEGEGRPLNVAHRESFPKELLVSKSYDRLFDGVDFASFDPAATAAMLPDALEENTHVSLGTVVQIENIDVDPALGGASG
jgi:hypothetical protein